MKYKTLYYDVSAFANRLPDDCLRIIAKYAYDESQYSHLERKPMICRVSWCVSTTQTAYESWVNLKISNRKSYRQCIFINSSNVCSYHVFIYDSDLNCNLNIYELINNCWEQIFPRICVINA